MQKERKTILDRFKCVPFLSLFEGFVSINSNRHDICQKHYATRVTKYVQI